MTTTTGAKTISFAGRAANSPQFDALYAEGMALVETTAAYLDGPGRAAARKLGSRAAGLYAAQSLELTTSLMQLASWLLLQRSLNTGEMSREQVLQERRKLTLGNEQPSAPEALYGELPAAFRELLDQARRLAARVHKLDESLTRGDLIPGASNQVIAQIDLLQTAFGRR